MVGKRNSKNIGRKQSQQCVIVMQILTVDNNENKMNAKYLSFELNPT